MKNGSRVLHCAAGCGRKIRVGMGPSWVICSACARQGIGDKLNKLRKGKT